MESNLNDATRDFTDIPQDIELDLVRTEILTVADNLRNSDSIPTVIGKYALGIEIGRGGMGIVYEAVDKELERTIAVKVLPHTRSSGSALARFHIEARAAAQLNHENIIPVYENGVQDGVYYFAMQLVRGLNFAEILKDVRDSLQIQNQLQETIRSKGQNPTSDADQSRSSSPEATTKSGSFSDTFKHEFIRGTSSTKQIVRSVASIGAIVANALHHAHERGVVHRDIKPSNLMVDREGKIWVTDFGLALIDGDPTLTHTGDLVGTLRYMSPEQAAGARAFIDNRTDIYSLGVTLYELATLKSACSGTNRREIFREVTFERPKALRRINPHIPKEFETIIYKATERNPEDRYVSALEMAIDLQRFLKGEPLLAQPVKLLKRFQNWFYEHPAATVGLGLCLLITLFASTITAASLLREATTAKLSLSVSESKRALLESSAARDDNPGLAVRLAINGAAGFPGYESDQVLLKALDGLHEHKTLQLDTLFPGALTVSQDGSMVVRSAAGSLYGIGEQNLELIHWQKEEVQRMASEDTITSCAWGANDRTLLTCSSSLNPQNMDSSLDKIEFGRVQVWDIGTGKPIRDFPNARQLTCRPDSFSANGKQLVLTTQDGLATVYRTSDWAASVVLQVPEGEILQAGFSPGSERIATWDTSGRLILWNAEGGQEAVYSYPSIQPLATSFEFALNSNRIVIYGKSGLKCFELGNDNRQPLLTLPDSYATFSPSGDILCAANFARGRFGLYRLPSGQPFVDKFTAHFVRDIKFSSDGKFLLVAGTQDVEIFDTATGEISSQCKGHQSPIQDLAVGSEGKFFSVDSDASFRVWNQFSDRQRRTIPLDLRPGSQLVSDRSADGTYALVGTISKPKTLLLDMNVLDMNDLGANPMTLSGMCEARPSDGNRLVTFDRDEAQVWDPDTSRKLVDLRLPNDVIWNCEHIRAKSLVVLRTVAGTLYHWDYHQNRLKTVTRVGERATAYKTSSDGGKLCFGTSQGTLVLVELDTGSRLFELACTDSISSVDFNDSGDKLVAVHGGAFAMLVAVDDGAVISELSATDVRFSSAKWCGEEKIVTFSSVDENNDVVIWSANDRSILARKEFVKLRDLQLVDNADSLAIAHSRGATLWNFADDTSIELTNVPCNRIVVDGKLAIVTSDVDEPFIETGLSSNRPEMTIFDIESQALLSKTELEFDPLLLTALPNRGRLIVAGNSLGAEIVEIDTGTVKAFCGGHYGNLLLSAFGPTAETIFSVSKAGDVRVHTIAGKGKLMGQHAAAITAVAISSDRSQLVTGDSAGTIKHWDLINQAELTALVAEGKPVSQLAFSSNNIHIVSTYGAPELKIWDLRTRSSETFKFEKQVLEAHFSPTGSEILTLLGEKRVIVAPGFLGTKKGAEFPRAVLLNYADKSQTTLKLEFACVKASFSSKGSFIGLLDVRGRVHLIDNDSKSPAEKIPAKWITDFHFSADESQLLTTSTRGQEYWDTQTRRLAGHSRDHQTTFGAVSRPTNGDKNSDLKWRLTIDREIVKIPVDVKSYAIEHAPRDLTADEKMSYQFLQNPLSNN